jgi:hypothetical protein
MWCWEEVWCLSVWTVHKVRCFWSAAWHCSWLDDIAARSQQFGQGPYTRDGSVLLNDVFSFKDQVALVAEEVNIERGILVEWYWQGKSNVCGEHVSKCRFFNHISHIGLVQDRIRASVVRCWRLTAHACIARCLWWDSKLSRLFMNSHHFIWDFTLMVDEIGGDV